MQIQNNEGQLKQEEAKLASTRREITLIRDKTRVLENDNDVAEPTDVLALVRLFFVLVEYIKLYSLLYKSHLELIGRGFSRCPS